MSIVILYSRWITLLFFLSNEFASKYLQNRNNIKENVRIETFLEPPRQSSMENIKCKEFRHTEKNRHNKLKYEMDFPLIKQTSTVEESKNFEKCINYIG